METKIVYNQETKWLHSGGEADITPPGGLGKLFFETFKSHAEKGLIAQIDVKTAKEETYKTFYSKCIKIALYMKDQGLKSGDIISMCSQNNMNNCAVMMAALFNGIILASTDPLMSVEDSKYLLDLVEPKLIFVCEKSFDLSQKATREKGTKIVTLYEHDSLDNIPAILEKYTENETMLFEPFYAANNTDTICIMFTSGTTGMPKAACLSHEMMCPDLKTPWPPGLRATIFTSLYWSTSALFALAIFVVGATKVNMRETFRDDIWECLHKTKCNVAFFSYGFCMLSIPHLKQTMPYLKFMLVAGGVLPLRFQNQLKELIPDMILFTIYGMTELGSVTENLGTCPPESAGLIVQKDLIIKIVDIDTEQPVDLNVLGEIRIKSKRQLNGYYKIDSKDIWDSDGFYKSGDLGYLNDKYELYVVDRIKEMFKYRGYHIIPEKIEKVLKEHPDVQLVVVIGVPDLIDDSHAKALVVLNDGSTITADELVQFTNDKIEDNRNHLRAGVKIITEADIPYTASNKINRRLLRQKFAN